MRSSLLPEQRGQGLSHLPFHEVCPESRKKCRPLTGRLTGCPTCPMRLAGADLPAAFAHVRREDFVRSADRPFAHMDVPLSIGHGQTISQPSTVRFMLAILQVEAGHKVLDVGSGSAWTTALLADLVGPAGEVTGVERLPALVRLGQQHLRKYHLPNACVVQATADLGYPSKAPYDRILVSAAAKKLPKALLAQLKEGGILVIPVGSAILQVVRQQGTYTVSRQEGFAFVPLVT